MRESTDAALTSASAEQTRALGRALGRALARIRGAPIVLAIEGELGAGKTTLVSGVLGEMGVSGPVRSPTYTLIEPYAPAGRSIYHLDLYRIASPGEVEALGIRDLLTPDAILLVEWPSRGAGVLPVADLAIAIGYPVASATGRRIVLSARSERGAELLAASLPVPSE